MRVVLPSSLIQAKSDINGLIGRPATTRGPDPIQTLQAFIAHVL